jgi:hypothetical protein
MDGREVGGCCQRVGVRRKRIDGVRAGAAATLDYCMLLILLEYAVVQLRGSKTRTLVAQSAAAHQDHLGKKLLF